MLASLLTVHADRDSAASGIAYALWLKSAPADLDAAPARANVSNVGQLMTDSKIVEGKLKLYPMARVGHCDAVARSD